MKRATTLTIGVIGVIALTGCGKSVIPAKAVADERGKAPTACLDALDRAEDLFGIINQVLDVTTDALTAAAYDDQDGLDAATADLTRLGNQIDRGAYESAAHECRNP